VQLDRDGKVVPQLATEWKRLDDLTTQFKLRQNIKFHNGEDFDGEAVKYSIARPLIPENNAGARTTYSGISGVDVIDKYTVNIKTSKPDPALLNRLSGFSMTMVAPKWAAQGNQVLLTEVNGTGPYKLAPGGYTGYDKPIRMVANETYWGGAPKIKKAQMRSIIELATRTAALRSGEVHVAKDVSVEEIAAINSSGRALAKVTQSNRIPYYVMDSRKGPLTDVRLRQAINYGANIDQIIKSVLYGNGTRVATTVAPWHVGFHPDLKPYPYDPDKAKALMREAGVPNGFDTEINYIQGRYMKDKEVAEAIAQELGKIGIKVKLNLREPAANTATDNAMEQSGLMFASWGNWIFDADNMLYARWHSSLSKTANAGKGTSSTPYQNAEYDKLVEDARVELDVAKRLDLYKKAQQKLFDDSVALFMYTLSDVFGVDNWILWEPRRDEMVWAHEMAYNE
jgi:peptide/nickel transport system substrate-binding protein